MAKTEHASWHGSGAERWIAAAALLLFPVIMAQVGREWTAGVALIAAAVIAALLLLIELIAPRSADPAYRAGVTTALFAAFLQTWINVVTNQGSPAVLAVFVLVLAAGAAAFAVSARAAGMARAMLGLAGVQGALTALVATDPSTAGRPGGVSAVVLLGGYFVALWLVSAMAFRQAARWRNAVPALG